ncbi:MAG: class I SAM-dependent methyltransferase, partial [Bryobacteraceae bacterium]
MTPLEELIRDRILSEGPIRFRRFMELALYHPEHGYYRRGRDPFGPQGDFFTAEQLQPVYGLLMARAMQSFFRELGEPEDFTIVELGAGRGEMKEAFSAWRYLPVECGAGELPQSFTGVVFANEFFDALPVDVAVRRGRGWRSMRVGWMGDGFVWVEAEPVDDEAVSFLKRFVGRQKEGFLAEIHLEALAWLERIARSLERGFLVVVDYGYTRQELASYPLGTLMSYYRHRASEDVLTAPGERDITAMVPFTALQQHGAACGLRTLRFSRLLKFLLDAAK